VDSLRCLDAEIGSGGLVEVGAPHLAVIVRLLGTARLDADVSQRLYHAASDLAGLIGWFMVDRGRAALAQRYFVAALTHGGSTAHGVVSGAMDGPLGCEAALAITFRPGRTRAARMIR
jgi:hypothetical protein